MCVCVCFLYSSVDGHRAVAVVTNAAVNIGGAYVFLS